MNKRVAIVLNALLIIMGTTATIISLLDEPVKMQIFYYTRLNNNLAIISSICFLWFAIKEKELPDWVVWLRFVAVIGLTVTFLTVVFILAPRGGYVHYLLSKSGWAHHTLCPIVSFISFMFFERPQISKKVLHCGIIPSLIYIAYIIPANILGYVDGPYFFLKVMNQPVGQSVAWLAGFITFIGLLGMGLFYLSAIIKKSMAPNKI